MADRPRRTTAGPGVAAPPVRFRRNALARVSTEPATDWLLVDGTARPFRAPTDVRGERLANLDQLSDDDRAPLIQIIDALANTCAPHRPRRSGQLTDRGLQIAVKLVGRGDASRWSCRHPVSSQCIHGSVRAWT